MKRLFLTCALPLVFPISCKGEGTIQTEYLNNTIFSDNFETGQLLGWYGIDSKSIIKINEEHSALKPEKMDILIIET